METGLRGKVAMVSGASKGIGRAVAEQLAVEGAHLSLCARSAGPLQTAAREIETKHGVTCLACSADLSRAGDIQEWVRATVGRFGGIDVLINNAGAAQGGPFLTVPDEAWLESWQLKLFGYIRVAREVFPHLQRRGGGRIVNVIGIAGVQPMENYMIGGAANAALLNFTKALADEGAPHGILVTGVNPGPIRTERWDGILVKWGAARGVTSEEAERDILRGVPLRRPGTAQEVANIVVFLASELSGYITGTTIAVDGGMTRTISEGHASRPTRCLTVEGRGHDAVVDDFIGRMIADASLKRFFEPFSTDSKTRIRQHLVDQVCNASGGPCVYTGRSMKVSHTGIGITEADWTVFVRHLTASLDKFKVPEREQNDVLAFVASVKRDIVEKP